MISRKRILQFAIGKMLRQDGWAEKYNPKNQFDVNQYDYSTFKEYVNALREKWQEYEDPEYELEGYWMYLNIQIMMIMLMMSMCIEQDWSGVMNGIVIVSLM